MWNAILSGLKALVAQLEAGISSGIHLLIDIIEGVFSAEEAQLMADAKPLLQQIAINLQNTQPGLSGSNFITALWQAAEPVLVKEGISLAHTAQITVASIVAHDLNIPDTTGNAGNLSGGSTVVAPDAPAA